MDPKAIEAQIAEKRQRQQAEKQQETAAGELLMDDLRGGHVQQPKLTNFCINVIFISSTDEEMVRQEQVALSLEQQHRAELKAIQRVS